MPTLKVDQEKCIGCGFCVSICPDVFELKDDGKSHVKDAKACAKCDCKAASDGCPVQAISFKA
jgi:ferredoxin